MRYLILAVPTKSVDLHFLSQPSWRFGSLTELWRGQRAAWSGELVRILNLITYINPSDHPTSGYSFACSLQLIVCNSVITRIA